MVTNKAEIDGDGGAGIGSNPAVIFHTGLSPRFKDFDGLNFVRILSDSASRTPPQETTHYMSSLRNE
jgi:hypothetical protein